MTAGKNRYRPLQIRCMSEILLYASNIYINTHLCSLIIVVVAAAMVISPLLERREISHIASLVVLRRSGGGRRWVDGESSCEDDRATQADSTGPTATNMLMLINTTHLIIKLHCIIF